MVAIEIEVFIGLWMIVYGFFLTGIIVCLTFYTHAVNNLQNTFSCFSIKEKQSHFQEIIPSLFYQLQAEFSSYCKNERKWNKTINQKIKKSFSHAILISSDKKIIRLVVCKKFTS